LGQRLGLKDRIKGHFGCSIERSVIDVPANAHFGWGCAAVLHQPANVGLPERRRCRREQACTDTAENHHGRIKRIDKGGGTSAE
jgi:hypothetical protein